MADLIARLPYEGVLPLTIGAVTLDHEDLGALTSLAPFKGRKAALNDALKAAHDLSLPAPLRSSGKAGARVLWFGRSHYLLAGPEPDASLGQVAALTDQSDAWCVVRLSGAGAVDALARLVPVDLRPAVFKRGHTVRTQVQHMSASITRVGDDGFVILVFRSMAKTLVHDLQTAMEAVAARG